jgi:hypothetical protein
MIVLAFSELEKPALATDRRSNVSRFARGCVSGTLPPYPYLALRLAIFEGKAKIGLLPSRFACGV